MSLQREWHLLREEMGEEGRGKKGTRNGKGGEAKFRAPFTRVLKKS